MTALEHKPSEQAMLQTAVEMALATLGRPAALTVAVNDPQRHTASASILELLVRHMPGEAIRLLVACGSHRFLPDEKHAFEHSLRGSMPIREIAWHDCRSENLTPVGHHGWRCHPWLLEDPAVLAIGSVEPHYFAGFTGAHKTVTIGCASYQDIEANHSSALSPNCRPVELADNPVYEGVAEMLSRLSAVQNVAAINLVQRGSTVLAATAGRPLEAMDKAIPVARKAFVQVIDQPLDVLVAQVDGPLGVSFYQADKGIKNNEWAVRDGGAIILQAACPKGLGQDQFASLLRKASTYRQALEFVQSQGYRLGDHKAVRLRHLTDAAGRNVRVYAVSDGLSHDDCQTLGFTKSPTIEAAMALASAGMNNPRSMTLPDAGNACLTLAGLTSRDRPSER